MLAPGPPARHHRSVIHLRSVTFRAPPDHGPRGFPFDLPALRGVTLIDFRAPVTMLVGENGSAGADLLSFDPSPLRRVRYDELEHVTLTRDVLRDPEAYLRHL